jgi:hypothetical protein
MLGAVVTKRKYWFIAMTGLAFGLITWSLTPNLRVTVSGRRAKIEILTFGEYPTSVHRMRLVDVSTRQTVWEVRADGTAELHTFWLSAGQNDAVVKFSDKPALEFKVVITAKEAFRLELGHQYQLTVWGSRWPFTDRSRRFELVR